MKYVGPIADLLLRSCPMCDKPGGEHTSSEVKACLHGMGLPTWIEADFATDAERAAYDAGFDDAWRMVTAQQSPRVGEGH